MKPRVLLVGRTRYRLPLSPSLRRKFDALGERMELQVLASAAAGGPTKDPTFRLVAPIRPRLLDGPAFYLALPFRVARELRRFRPEVVLVQGAHEAAGVHLGRLLARSPAKLVLDVHGDWRVATRLYGSRARGLLSPVADGVAALALRRADAVRTVSGFTTSLVREAGVEPAAVFPAFMDLEPFLARPPSPLPDRPAALFVGVLERYKNVDGLVAAWRQAAPRLPGAELHIVGRGHLVGAVEALVRDLPEQTRWTPVVPNEQLPFELDRATCLVLPSRREGMGRVVVEALCRGRPVVGSRSGGIRDLVEDGVNGLLVDEENPDEIAAALVRLLSDRALAERLAAAARPGAEQHVATPEQYAESIDGVVAAARLGRKPP